MVKFSDHTLEEIKQRLPLSMVLGQYMSLTKAGGADFKACCPFHNEKTPSFYIHDDKGYYHCFGCGKSGNIFNFIMEMEKMSFPEAVEFLAAKAGVEIKQESQAERVQRSKNDTLRDLYTKIANSFHYILVNTKAGEIGRQYLENRHISREMWDRFNLGYAPADPKWLYNFLRKHNYSDDILKESGLFSQRVYPATLFRNRLMFPIRTWDGKTIAFSGRDLDGTSKAKYINTPETPIFSKKHNLFGIHEAVDTLKKEQHAILCEGNFDVVALHQAGITNAMAPLGTAYTKEQSILLKRYCSKVSLLFDTDQAGTNATIKGLTLSQSSGLENEVIFLQNAKDPCECLEKYGENSLKESITAPISAIEYLVTKALNLYDIKKPKGKDMVFSMIEPYINATQSQIEKQALVRYFSQKINIDERIVTDALSAKTRISKVDDEYEDDRETEILPFNPSNLSSDYCALIALANNRQLYPRYRNRILPEDLEDDMAKALYDILEDASREDIGKSDENFIQLIGNRQLQSDVKESFYSKAFEGPIAVTMIEEAIDRMKLRKLRKRRAMNTSLLEIALNDGLEESIADLLREKQKLDGEIASMQQKLRNEANN